MAAGKIKSAACAVTVGYTSDTTIKFHPAATRAGLQMHNIGARLQIIIGHNPIGINGAVFNCRVCFNGVGAGFFIGCQPVAAR